MAHYELTDQGNETGERGLVADHPEDCCACCNQEFEIEDDEDEAGHPKPRVIIPIECDKGNFCSEACRAVSMYAAQDESGKLALRRYYLGAQLLLEYRRPAERILKEWEVDCDDSRDVAESVTAALSPDGGSFGVPGPEDDAAGARLLPAETYKILWSGLYMGRRAAIGEKIRAEQNVKQYPGSAYWEQELKQAEARLAETEQALRAVEGLGKIVE